MIVQLVIPYTNVVKLADGRAFKYKDFKRSAPMSIKDIVKRYGDWMSSHQNWSIHPVDAKADFQQAGCFGSLASSFNSLVDTPCCFQAGGRSSSSLSNLVLGRPSVSLSNLVLFCGLAIIRLKNNIGSRAVHSAEGLHEHEDHERQDIGYAHPVSICVRRETLPTVFILSIPKERRRNV